MDRLRALQAAITAALTAGSGHPDGSADGSVGAVVAVCRACAEAMPGDGAAVTLMASDAMRETVAATDEVIAAVERAQYSLGEGPSLQAFQTGRPVLVADLAAAAVGLRWPALAPDVGRLSVVSLYALPLRLGAITLGVCLFYRRSATGLGRADLAFALRAADMTLLALLEVREAAAPARPGGSPDGDWLDGGRGGRGGRGLSSRVHQATGMLIAQLGVDAGAAFARLRAHAFSQGVSIEQVAGDIVDRRLRLERDPT